MTARPDLEGTPWAWFTLGQARPVVCLISRARLPWASAWRWNAGWWPNTPHKLYGKRNVGRARSTVYLHREIQLLKEPAPKSFYVVDHINGQPLDNRDENLRWLTPWENTQHRIPWDDVPSLEEIAEQLLSQAHDRAWLYEKAALAVTF